MPKKGRPRKQPVVTAERRTHPPGPTPGSSSSSGAQITRPVRHSSSAAGALPYYPRVPAVTHEPHGYPGIPYSHAVYAGPRREQRQPTPDPPHHFGAQFAIPDRRPAPAGEEVPESSPTSTLQGGDTLRTSINKARREFSYKHSDIHDNVYAADQMYKCAYTDCSKCTTFDRKALRRHLRMSSDHKKEWVRLPAERIPMRHVELEVNAWLKQNGLEYGYGSILVELDGHGNDKTGQLSRVGAPSHTGPVARPAVRDEERGANPGLHGSHGIRGAHVYYTNQNLNAEHGHQDLQRHIPGPPPVHSQTAPAQTYHHFELPLRSGEGHHSWVRYDQENHAWFAGPQAGPAYATHPGGSSQGLPYVSPLAGPAFVAPPGGPSHGLRYAVPPAGPAYAGQHAGPAYANHPGGPSHGLVYAAEHSGDAHVGPPGGSSHASQGPRPAGEGHVYSSGRPQQEQGQGQGRGKQKRSESEEARAHGRVGWN